MKRSLIFSCALALAACSKSPAPSPGPQPGLGAEAAAPPLGAASAVATASSSGAASAAASASAPRSTLLDEAAFAAAHAADAKSAPALRGATVELAGTRAYLSLPKQGKPPLAGLVVIHEWWGLDDHIERWSDRLAEDGYAALAVDLFDGKIATRPEDAAAQVKALDATRARTTLLAASHFLRTDPRVRAEKVGAIGWCFGGKWSLELGLTDPKLDAVVVYYGQVPSDPEKLAALRSPVLGIFGKKDASIPSTQLDGFERALDTLHIEHRVLRYDADHAFANPRGAHYDKVAARDSWRHVREFFARRLKGAPAAP
ncbi:MAG: dienelactone hydrolase family protein [Sorangiineae bacterium]|nr:dienelactone hydrolase family protein [Polyangiaceae bacterium]MEB2321318.1 dienelactone hydrolase family protein [Sorangiineae bacterium]